MNHGHCMLQKRYIVTSVRSNRHWSIIDSQIQSLDS